MPNVVYDYHEIQVRTGEKLGDTVRRHLRYDHGIAVTHTVTLNEMSAVHAEAHGGIGRTNPENDSDTTTRQKRDLQARHIAKFGVILPEWVYTHSYLSDLKSLDRCLQAAYLARPSSELNQPLTGVDNPPQA